MSVAIPSVFIETDIQMDVDDVGALALAIGLERRGVIRIAGVGVNTRSRWGARAVERMKTAYGAEFPVGVLRPLDDTVVGERDYARLLGEDVPSDADWPDAHELLKAILEAADDGSVRVVSIGFYGNLVRLLSTGSAADRVAAGRLVGAKVRSTIVMGGLFPRGREFNFVEEPATTRDFLAAWPTPIDFIGQEVGNEVITGRDLSQALGAEHPVAVAYRAYCGEGAGRPSWDLIAVYAAAFPAWRALAWSAPGHVSVNAEDGANDFVADPHGPHRYALLAAPANTVAAALDDVLLGRDEGER